MWGAGAECDATHAVPSRIDAEPAGPEGDNLQQAARDHQIFQEVNHLVLIGEVRMERESGGECEDGQRGGR